MIESIVFSIFIISLGGIILISVRKMPVLVKLPQNGKIGVRDHHVILNIENRIKNIFIYFEKQIFLHKFLSWFKIVTLRTETKIDTHLHRIRKKAQKMDRELKDKK